MNAVGTVAFILKSDAAKLIKDLKRSKKSMQRFKKSIKKTSQQAKRFARVAAKAAAAAVALGTAFSVKEAGKFEKALAEVSTLLDDTSGLEAMALAVKDLSREFGTMPVANVQAMYQIISAGAKQGAEAMQRLTVSNKLAIGGITSVEVAADGLTSAMNAYAEHGLTATEVADSMFVAMKFGKTKIDELSESMGTVASLASKVDLEFSTLLAAVAAVTKGGQNTNVVMVGMRAILTSLVKPSAEAAEAAKEMGLNFNATAISAAGGFLPFLEDVIKKTGGSEEKLAALFGNVRALIPILTLASNDGKVFSEAVGEMAKKAGAMDEAVEKMAKTTSHGFDIMRAELSVAAADFGDILLPSINRNLKALNTLRDGEHLTPLVKGMYKARQGALVLARLLVSVAEATVMLASVAALPAFFAFDPLKEKLKAMNDGLVNAGKQLEFEEQAAMKSAATTRAKIKLEKALYAQAEKYKAFVNSTDFIGPRNNLASKAVESVEVTRTVKTDDAASLPDMSGEEFYPTAANRGRGDMAAAVTAEYEKQKKLIMDLKDKSASLFIETRTEAENYKAELLEINMLKEKGLISDDVFIRKTIAMKAALQSNNKELQKGKQLGEEMGWAFSSAFEKAIIDGEGLRGVLGGIFKDIQKIILRKTVTDPLGGFLSKALGSITSGLFGGGLFGGGLGGGSVTAGTATVDSLFAGLSGRAGGGDVSAHGKYIVGERGPELFQPKRSGSIVPNNEMGGMTIYQNVNVDARNSDVSAAKLQEAARRGAQEGYNQVLDDFQRNGNIRQTI